MSQPSVDVGDRCLLCGRTTAPGSGRFVNRLPSFGQDRVHPSLLAANPGVLVFDGYYCADCQADDCEGCQAEAAGLPFNAGHYIEATGLLCDYHDEVVTCTTCGVPVENNAMPVVVESDGWTLRHVVCP